MNEDRYLLLASPKVILSMRAKAKIQPGPLPKGRISMVLLENRGCNLGEECNGGVEVVSHTADDSMGSSTNPVLLSSSGVTSKWHVPHFFPGELLLILQSPGLASPHL